MSDEYVPTENELIEYIRQKHILARKKMPGEMSRKELMVALNINDEEELRTWLRSDEGRGFVSVRSVGTKLSYYSLTGRGLAELRELLPIRLSEDNQ